jgi:L-asparaginase type I
MADANQKRSGRVLVVLTGGNIGLIATTDRQNQSVLKPAGVAEIKKIVLGSETADTLVLRERSLVGLPIHVDFTELRNEQRRFADPEEFDSAQVNPSQWTVIAETIKAHYDRYEGFVILHGLDTMAYTASALSFMLRNLRVPVILTGSQRPLNFPRTDATQNIFSAITLAASASLGLEPEIPEVCVYSYDTLFRGNRTSMASASSYRTFDSPNFPPIASVGEHIEIQAHLVRVSGTAQLLTLRNKVDAKVVILDVFPGMGASIIHNVREKETGIKGVLLRTYGMGTAPTSASVLEALEGLSDAEIVVMNVTQARSGRISHGQDPVSLRLFEQGVVSGVDMTAEAAYAKMVILLSEKDDATEAGDLLQIESCGEQSQSIFHIHFDANQTREDESGDGAFRALLRPTREQVVGQDKIKQNLRGISYIQLRLLGLEPMKEDNKPVNRTIELEAALIDESREPNAVVAHLKTDILRWFAKGRNTINVAYDITPWRDQLLSPDRIPSTMLRLQTNEAVRWKRASIVIFAGLDVSAS